MGKARRIHWFFILLIPFLFLQVVLREISEPYPAVLLPAGSILLHSTGDFTAYTSELVAVDAQGREYPFAAADLLDAVPSQYHGNVIARELGIGVGREVRSVLGVQFGHPLTPSQIAETRQWIRSKLRSVLGVDVVRLDVLTVAVAVSYAAEPRQQARTLVGTVSLSLLGEEE